MTTRPTDLDPLALYQELAHFVRFELGRLRERGRLAVVVLPVPVAPPETLLRIDPGGGGVVWDPPGGPRLAGLGEACRLELQGEGRFAALDGAASALWTDLQLLAHPDAPPFTPALLGGFAFEPHAGADPEWKGFGDGFFVLPRWTYAVLDGGAVLALALTGPDELEHLDPYLQRLERIVRFLARPPESFQVDQRTHRVVRQMEREQWAGLVERARGAIADGTFEKVVLARQTHLTFEAAIDVPQVLGKLRELQPDAYRFAFRRGGTTFLGASPEPLVVKRGLAVHSEALAGTIPRPAGGGATAAALAEALAGSAKDRAEHAPVVDAIREGLAAFCADLDVPGSPEVRVLRDVLHLSTPVRGTLRDAVPLSTLVEALHPTPAMGGFPREAALAWLAANEPERRGWYASPVGRIDARGDGEFAVAIRSALLSGNEALVYAGAGIVAGSDPEAEFEETAAKEQTMLAALGA